VDLISRVFTAGSHRRELMTIARLITGIITRPLGPFFPLAADEAFGRNDRLTSVLLSYLLREKKSMAHSSPDQRQPRQFCHRERSLTETVQEVADARRRSCHLTMTKKVLLHLTVSEIKRHILKRIHFQRKHQEKKKCLKDLAKDMLLCRIDIFSCESKVVSMRSVWSSVGVEVEPPHLSYLRRSFNSVKRPQFTTPLEQSTHPDQI
jgi:hypothetical protein